MSIQLHKVTATEAVVESLKERIRNGEFKPGEKLSSEQEFLKEYDVSRLTLREALAKLTAWGVIRVRHGKGAYVAENISISAFENILIPMFPQQNLERMNDLVEARNMIESELAANVAENRTKDQIIVLEKLLKYDNRKINSAKKFADRDYAFHLALSQMAGNEFLYSMYQALYRQIQFFLIQYARSITDWKEALDRHLPILEAIIDKNPKAARTLAREHAKICASYIHEYGKKTD
jgi:GntR family transcriptional repressor for pyruvate dehydrogenase complex